MTTIEVIAAIVAEKKANNIYPTHALEHEVTTRHPQAKTELKELEQKGDIWFGPTINDRYIRVKPTLQ